MQRRELFTGLSRRLNQEKKSLKPPYLLGSLETCETCEAPCIETCETDILFKNDNNQLEVSFAKQGCTYCEACAIACEKNVLSLEAESVNIQASVYIDEDLCMAHHDVMCMSCKEPCLDDAIKFEGLFKPIINPLSCTSCGFCISRCPTHAIKMLIA